MSSVKEQREFDRLMIELQIKIDRIADFGLVGEVFNNHVEKVQEMGDITRGEAALVVGLFFAEIGGLLDEEKVAKYLVQIRRNDDEIRDLMKRLRVNSPLE
jgi:hypothetical protein